MKNTVYLLMFLALGLVVPMGDIAQVDLDDKLLAQKAGGFRAKVSRRPTGARSRTKQATRPSTRPTTRPAPRPSTRPAARPSKPEATRPSRPNTSRPSRPTYGPADTGSQSVSRPANRPANAAASSTRVRPVARPSRRVGRPITRPAGWRPPYYRPPLWRPPLWRPPYYPPPYVRPPHWNWGDYYWGPRWGWYFTAALATSTLEYVATLPDEGDECERAELEGETVYICDGVLYRATYYKDEQVYEIVSEPDEVVDSSDSSNSKSS